MNLSRISLTKYLGCLFPSPCEAALRLEAKTIGSPDGLRDLDPFAVDCNVRLCHLMAASPLGHTKANNRQTPARREKPQ